MRAGLAGPDAGERPPVTPVGWIGRSSAAAVAAKPCGRLRGGGGGAGTSQPPGAGVGDPRATQASATPRAERPVGAATRVRSGAERRGEVGAGAAGKRAWGGGRGAGEHRSNGGGGGNGGGVMLEGDEDGEG